MADVTIVPAPSQVQTVPAGGQQASGATQAPAITSLPRGTDISGTIIGKDTSGNFVLRTDQGNLSVHSNAPLTYNSDVVLRLTGGTNSTSTTARIISVNGESYAEFAAPDAEDTADSLSPNLLAATTQPEAPAASAPANTAVNAVVVSAPAPPAGAAATAATAPLAPGAAVVIRVTDAPQTATVENNTPASTQTAPANTATATPATANAQVTAESAPASPVSATPAVTVTAAAATPVPASPVATPTAAAVSPAAANTATTQNETALPASLTVTPTEQAAAPQAQAQTSPGNALYAAYKQAPMSDAPPAQVAASSSSTTPALAATVLAQGQVVTTSPEGQVVVQTSQGAVTVQAEASANTAALAPGANVTIESPGISQPALQITLPAVPAAIAEIAASWDTLKDIITSVTPDANPATNNSAAASTAANSLLARLPQLGPEFIATSSAFISALAEGNIKKVLGDDTIENLQQNGKADMLDKFAGELNEVTQSFTQAPDRQSAPNWQMLLLPFMFQEELQQARLYVKREPPKKDRSGSESNSPDTRFIVEVDLSELGPMQMDGLVRKKEDSTAFDLIIRSATAFSQEQQMEITGLYNNAAGLTGFHGSIGFQVSRDFPVKPLEEMQSAGHQSITV